MCWGSLVGFSGGFPGIFVWFLIVVGAWACKLPVAFVTDKVGLMDVLWVWLWAALGSITVRMVVAGIREVTVVIIDNMGWVETGCGSFLVVTISFY